MVRFPIALNLAGMTLNMLFHVDTILIDILIRVLKRFALEIPWGYLE